MPTTVAPPARREHRLSAAPRVAPAAAAPAPPVRRDVALDLVRGLAIVILVVNHIHLDSALEYATEPFLSAAEALVLVSGVVTGMVFGRRWLCDGPRSTAAALWRRALTLYVASVAVVALVGILVGVPWLNGESVSVAPRTTVDLYAFDGVLRTALAIVTLEAGPWQFNVVGLFVVLLAVAPAVLWALARGWWPAVMITSWALYLVGRATTIDIVPAQSEGPFPALIWQLLFVHGLVVGWHRHHLGRAVRRLGRVVAAAIVVVAAVAAYLRVHEVGIDPLGLDGLLGFDAADWRRWDAAHFSKTTLDPARLATMVSFTAAAWLAFTRFQPTVMRAAGWLLLPLGRSSFYVFIMQVFVCLFLASVPALAGDGPGMAASTAVQVGALALLLTMVRRRFLFRWVPR